MTIEIERLDRIKASNRVFGIFRGVTPIGKTPGNVFYVDYNNGDDNNDGRMISTAKQTIGAALSLCINNVNDTVFVLGGNYNNELVTINVEGTHIIGLGPRLVGGMGFNITADHVEITGFSINHSSASPLINITGDYCYLHHCVIGGGVGVGIMLNGTLNSKIEDNTIYNNGGDGINIIGATSECIIAKNNIVINDGDGIRIVGGTANHLFIYDNLINFNEQGTYTTGINVGENNNNNCIYNNVISGNYPDISDTGTGNIWTNNKGIIRMGSTTLSTGENDVLNNCDLGKSGMVSIDFDIYYISDPTTVTARLYKKIDNTNYRIVDLQTATSDNVGLSVSGFFQGGKDRLRVTIECDPDRVDEYVIWKLIEV
jgi:parallel beta-helix repeat protein